MEESNDIFEQPKTVDALSEAPDLLSVEAIEQSAVEPPKGVEAYGLDKCPELAIDDSEAPGEPQTEMAQGHSIESIAPAQAEGQDTPVGMCSCRLLWLVSLLLYIRLNSQGGSPPYRSFHYSSY